MFLCYRSWSHVNNDYVNNTPFIFISRYGESTVNDAVSIVMFNTLTKFLLSSMSAGGVFEAIGIFIIMFVGSAVVSIS